MLLQKQRQATCPTTTSPAPSKRRQANSAPLTTKAAHYEGYGPGGVAVIVEVLTDNRNRTAAEIRHLFDKYGNGMGNSGCVAWMFDKKGHIVIERSAKIDEEELMMAALDAGADDFNAQDDCFEVFTSPADFSAVREALEAAGYTFLSAEQDMIPSNTVDVNDPEMIAKIERMLDMFDDNDDVQEVFHNAILPEEEDED